MQKREVWFFVVGLVLLLFACGIATSAFMKETLTPDQRAILSWIFPLASGFSAGAFVGSLTLKEMKWKGGVISASGGFAVWLISFLVFPSLLPAPPGYPEAAKPPKPSNESEAEVERLIGNFNGMRSELGDNPSPETRKAFGARVASLANMLGSVSEEDLSPQFVLAKYDALGLAQAVAASTVPDQGAARQHAEDAIKSSQRARDLLQAGDPAVADWAKQNDVEMRLQFSSALGAAANADSENAKKVALEKLPPDYRKQFTLTRPAAAPR